jgi:hypothetical protein
MCFSFVRDHLRNAGVDAKLGGINRFNSVADVLENFQSEAMMPGSQVQ